MWYNFGILRNEGKIKKMFVDFDSVFHPTPEQKRKQIDQVNQFTRLSVEKNGECCNNCGNAICVRVGESPCSSYTSCKYNKKLRFERITTHRCNKYKVAFIPGGSEEIK